MSLSKLRNALLYNPGSLFSNVGVLLLWEKGVQSRYALTPIDMKGHQNITPDFIRLNPMGKVPVLIHDGRAIPDSLAIAQFLDKENGSLRSHDDKVVSVAEQWRQVRVLALWMGKKQPDEDMTQLEEQLNKSRQQVLDYDRQEGGGDYATRLAAHDDRAKVLLDHTAYLHHQNQWNHLLDRSDRALEHQQYLVDNEYSLADIYAISFLFWYLQKVEPFATTPVFTGRQRLERYYHRQLDRSSVRSAFNLSH